MRFRNLRVAFSILCGIASVLLVVAWVRSYVVYLETYGPPPGISAWRGRLFVGGVFRLSPIPPDTDIVPPRLTRILGVDILTDGPSTVTYDGTGHAIPIGLLVLLTIALTTAPWICWRFSLRTALIATALLALMLGLTVYAAK